MSTPSSPGWYENPDNPDELRYFDGILWTSNTTPLRTRQPQPPQPPVAPAPSAPSAPTQTPPHQQQPPSGWGQQPGQYPQQPGQFPQQPQQPGQRPQGQQPGRPGQPGGQPQLAGYGSRVVAYLVDGIIIAIASMILGGFFLWQAFEPVMDRLDGLLTSGDVAAMNAVLNDVRLGWLAAFLAVQLLIMLAYNVWFLVKFSATPGKLMMGISVRRLDRPGTLDADTAIRRAGFMAAIQAFGNVPYIATFATMALVADLVWPIADPRRQALHDKVAKTIVIKGRVGS